MVSGRMTGRLSGQVALFVCLVHARLGGVKNAEIQERKCKVIPAVFWTLKLRPGNLDVLTLKLFIPALEQVLIT